MAGKFSIVDADASGLPMRLALCGIAGSGKTYTALSIGQAFGSNVVVIDAEHGSSKLYCRDFRFKVMELPDFSPRTYVEALGYAQAQGFDVVIVDGISQAWASKGGALDQVNRASGGDKSRPDFMAWRDVSPQHNDMVEAMLSCRSHLIVTMRSKVYHAVEKDERGRNQVRKIGLAPIQREGMDYEFHVVCDVAGGSDGRPLLTVGKTRFREIAGRKFPNPGVDFGRLLLARLNDAGGGAPAPRPAEAEAAPEPPTLSTLDAYREWYDDFLARLRQRWANMVAKPEYADLVPLDVGGLPFRMDYFHQFLFDTACYHGFVDDPEPAELFDAGDVLKKTVVLFERDAAQLERDCMGWVSGRFADRRKRAAEAKLRG